MQGERAEGRGKRGKEWWNKRPLAGHSVSTNAGTNKWFKRLLHRIERRQNKEVVKKEFIEEN